MKLEEHQNLWGFKYAGYYMYVCHIPSLFFNEYALKSKIMGQSQYPTLKHCFLFFNYS